MEQKEQDGRMFNQPGAHTAQAEVQDAPPQTSKVFKSVSPRHAVIGARPFCSPEYSPDFHKSGSMLPGSTFGVPYSEKKRLLDKQEEIQEVKQLDEWRPAVGIFTALLEGLDDK